ncbi:MAG TPA: hypothetical protein VGJ18_06290 [Gemmatimonadaceae bacterium]|jgi:hypothetical protein
MNPRKASPLEGTPYDAGTLWTMRHFSQRARCALLAWPTEWELRVIVDGQTLLSERSSRGEEAFALAETWRQRMVEQHWTQIVPTGTPDHGVVEAMAALDPAESRGPE